ncbi:Fibropellin-3 [Holothuria leucospilota]|uniref:Fibropellin-3 n=1 Tax=Holothuria leucospilota TaxID=206669 RepID=A0A9Q1HCK3_HOLLE|nr:Fibropellin-3 [Holothuria leucospilota]
MSVLLQGTLLILTGTLGYSQADIPCEDPSVCPNGTKCFYRPCSPREEDFVCECSDMIPGIGLVGYDCNSFGPNHNGRYRPSYYETCYGSHCREGSFQSSGYPNQYRNRETAIYLLFVPGARNITFTFEGEGGFEIEAYKDDLYVGTGLDINPQDLKFKDINTKGKEVRYFDNGSVAVDERYPPPFSFKTDAAWMYFETDINIQLRGWRLSWTAEVNVLKHCPDSMVIETCNNEEKVSWTEPSVIDPSVNVTSSNLPGDIFSIGSHTVVFETEERFQNVEQCIFKIEVKKKPTCTNSSRPMYVFLITTTPALVMILLLGISLCLFLRYKRSTKANRDEEVTPPAIPPRSPIDPRRNYENAMHRSHFYDQAP